jgi:hypothetical protein
MAPSRWLPYTLDAEADFIFPSSLHPPFFHPHLPALLFNCHHSSHRAPLLTWAVAAPSTVAVTLRQPRPLRATLPQAPPAADSR